MWVIVRHFFIFFAKIEICLRIHSSHSEVFNLLVEINQMHLKISFNPVFLALDNLFYLVTLWKKTTELIRQWLTFIETWEENIVRGSCKVYKCLWTSRIGAKSVFLNISRDILKNTPMAPLREVHSCFVIAKQNNHQRIHRTLFWQITQFVIWGLT